MRWLVIAAAICGGCGIDDVPIDFPLVDFGYDYECTMTITCDDQVIEEKSAACMAPGDGQLASNELFLECVNKRVVELGCSSWSCASLCSGVGYCTL